jgi:hypothetical protein
MICMVYENMKSNYANITYFLRVLVRLDLIRPGYDERGNMLESEWHWLYTGLMMKYKDR